MVLLAPSVFVVKGIHATFIRQYGVGGYMCEGMIEGCLERAMTHIYKYQPFPKLFMKAGAILYSYITFHPFVDGNKRTAFETTKIFLLLNGYELIAPEDGVDFTKAIADGKITKVEEIAGWLKKYSTRDIEATLSSWLLKFVLLLFSKSSRDKLRGLPEDLFLLLKGIKSYPE